MLDSRSSDILKHRLFVILEESIVFISCLIYVVVYLAISLEFTMLIRVFVRSRSDSRFAELGQIKLFCFLYLCGVCVGVCVVLEAGRFGGLSDSVSSSAEVPLVAWLTVRIERLGSAHARHI